MIHSEYKYTLKDLLLGKMTTSKFLAAMRLWGTRVPIPNTRVKTQPADGTMLETAWESRWLPESKKRWAYSSAG